ncbi:MAG: O-antigen ligase family protein, partial [Anaerolineae bacterium]|nr:O-antigen ligase family protein [Anaerolineae bacterium]
MNGVDRLQDRDSKTEYSSSDSREDYGGLAALLPTWMIRRPDRLNLPAPLTLGLIALALLVAVLSPFLARSPRIAMLVGLGISGLGAAVLLHKCPVLGLASISVLSLAVPVTIGTGSQTGINITVILILLMTGLWLLDLIFNPRKIQLLPLKPVFLTLVFCAVAIAAFAFGQLNWFPTKPAPITAQIGGLMIFLLSAGAFLLYAHQIKTENELKWVVLIFFIVGFANILLRGFGFMQPYIFTVFVREAVLGALFFNWLIALAAGQALCNPRLAPFWRVVLIGFILLFFYQHLSQSRDWVSGWLPPLISVIVVAFFYRPRLGVLLGIAGLAFLMMSPGTIGGLLGEGDNPYSVLTRLEAWKIMWEIIKVSPLLGVGMANYYWYTPLFKILGYRVSFNSHNNYIDIVAQTGIIGLAVFIWLLWEIWLVGWKTLKHAPEGFPRAYVIGALA